MMQSFVTLSDEELIDLLFSEEDRLPMAAVEEFLRRGDRLVSELSEIVYAKNNWICDVPEWWAAVHATYLLGVIGGEAVIPPLLAALRWSDAFDCDWITEDLPSIFGKIGPAALVPLRSIAFDLTAGWGARTIAMQGMAAVTVYHPERADEVFSTIGEFFINPSDQHGTDQMAAGILLDFLRREYYRPLLDFAEEEQNQKEEDPLYPAVLSQDEVKELFERGEANIWNYTRDWLDFYDEENIRERQERWAREEQEAEDEEEFFPYTRHKVGRNDFCPCGSGKKFKRCCGLN
jgi:hypothetical protein